MKRFALTLIVFFAIVCSAQAAYYAQTSSTVSVMGIGESTSWGPVYDWNAGTYSATSNDYVPNRAATLATSYSGVPTLTINKAVSGSKIASNLVSGAAGTSTSLATDQSRVVIIMSGINDALRSSYDLNGGLAVPGSTAAYDYGTSLTTIINNVKRTGKVPFVLMGAGLTTDNLWGCDASDYIAAYGLIASTQNGVVSGTGALYEATARIPALYHSDADPTKAGSSDGIHYTSGGYQMIAARAANTLSSNLVAIRNAQIVSRWYAMELNSPPSSTWKNYWSGRINAVGIDAAAEECYTTLGVSESVWIQSVLTNMGLGSSLYATCYNQMNTYSTNKHGKILNWMIDAFLINTDTSGTYYQARCTMLNKTSVAFAWCYTYNHSTDGSAMTSVTSNPATVYTATSGF